MVSLKALSDFDAIARYNDYQTIGPEEGISLPERSGFVTSSRPAAGDSDYRAIHRLLTETVPITPPCWNWDIRRWEGRRFYDPAVDTGSMLPANRLYSSIGCNEAYKLVEWEKRF
jgi:hypothetical protein